VRDAEIPRPGMVEKDLLDGYAIVPSHAMIVLLFAFNKTERNKL
jgi:hypothetical protein